MAVISSWVFQEELAVFLALDRKNPKGAMQAAIRKTSKKIPLNFSLLPCTIAPLPLVFNRILTLSLKYATSRFLIL